MRLGRDTAGNGIGGIDIQAVGALHGGRKRIAMGENETGHAVGKRGLADSLRAADQPGMRNASAAIGIEQCRLGIAMTKQVGGLPRVRNRHLHLGLAAHAGAAVLPVLVVKKRSRKADQIFIATFAGSSVASISTQRSGSSFAICR